MDNLSKLFSEKLRGLRAENQLTLDNVAEYLGIHRETVRKYENNPLLIGTGTLLELLELYKVKPIIFFEQVYGRMP